MSADGASWILFDASPDILAQLQAFPEAQPAGAIRDTALLGIVLTDSQVDHTTGLLMLREGSPLKVYCTDSVHDDLSTANPIFGILVTPLRSRDAAQDLPTRTGFAKTVGRPRAYPELMVNDQPGTRSDTAPLPAESAPASSLDIRPLPAHRFCGEPAFLFQNRPVASP